MDGHALGAAQAVTTRHGAGAPQAFSFGGSFAPGAHQVSPSLLNDWNPATGADRNLYVQGAALNGTGSASVGGFVSGDASQPLHMLTGTAAGQQGGPGWPCRRGAGRGAVAEPGDLH